jgi:hypothetical protein
VSLNDNNALYLKSNTHNIKLLNTEFLTLSILGSFAVSQAAVVMIFYLDPEPEPIVDVPVESWLDTGEWLGLIYNTYAPWVYSPRLSGWIFLPVQETDEGGWVFIPAVRAATAE